MESPFHSLKTDRYYGRSFATERELIATGRSYMPFYDLQRVHSSIGDVAPATFEARRAN
jgi:transposase InsO family protein